MRARTALGWLAALAVAVFALVVGTTDREERTDAERVESIAASVQCPACAGQSVADSDAVAARNLYGEIERRVAEGHSDDEIRSYLVTVYGEHILMNPPSSGTAGLVWALPVAGLVLAAGGLVAVFRRWARA